MKFQDCMLVKVDRAKPGELVVKFSVKEEDYTLDQYNLLFELCRQGQTMDIELVGAESNTPPLENSLSTEYVDPSTGEINGPHQQQEA